MSYSLATPFSPYAQHQQAFNPAQGPFTGPIADSPAPQQTQSSPMQGKVQNALASLNYGPASFAYSGQAQDGTGGGRFAPNFSAPQSVNGYSVPFHQQASNGPAAQAPAAQAMGPAGPPPPGQVGSADQYRQMGSGWLPSQQTAQSSLPGGQAR